MGLVNLEGKEKLFLLLSVLLNHTAEQCWRNLTQELCEGCLAVVPSSVTVAVRGCSAPCASVSPQPGFPVGFEQGLAQGRAGTGGSKATRCLLPPPSPSPQCGVTAAVVAFVVTQKKL